MGPSTNFGSGLAMGGDGTGSGNGGNVSVTLGSGVTLTTFGNSSVGILAQSVGGGGGVMGQAGATETGALVGSGGGKGTAGTVAVTVSGNIVTSGDSAHGVFAQAASGNSGSSSTPANVTVAVNGSILVSGAGANGVYAQSSGSGMGTVGVTVASGALVQGGAAAVQSGEYDGAGIFINQGTSSTIANAGTITSVGGSAGVAIRGVDTVLTITNTGTITGQVLDPPPPGRDRSITLNNEASGVLNAGPNIEADVNNGGLITVRGPGAFNHSQITGNLTQGSSGRLLINADFNTQQADRLAVGGAASLAGLIELRTTSILPQRPIEILRAGGGLAQQGIAVTPTTLFGFGLAQSGGDLMVSANSANFAPPAAALSRSEEAVANGLQAVWDAGGNSVFGRFFSALDIVAGSSPSAYAQELNQLSPRASVALGARIPAETHDFTDAMLSCPEFADGTALVIDGRCVWGRFTGRFTSQGAADGIPAFDVDTYTYQVGGEFAVAPDWFVDGALAFQTSTLDSHNDSSTGSGRGGYGGVALKWQPGFWRLALAVSGGYSQFDTSREIAMPAFGGEATASPAVYSIAARVRTAYNFVFAGGYVRPYLDLDLIHTHTPAYTESGPPTLSLFFAQSGQTTFVATPAVEIGRRIDLDNGVTLRPYADIGVSLFSNGDWQVQSGFVGAPAGAGLFTTTISEGHAVGRVSAGIQLLGVGNLDLRLRYEGEFAADTTSHAGLLTVAWRF
jgi:uncharacterized protein YhjY with autotransporter beta-barrel domain